MSDARVVLALPYELWGLTDEQVRDTLSAALELYEQRKREERDRAGLHTLERENASAEVQHAAALRLLIGRL